MQVQERGAGFAREGFSQHGFERRTLERAVRSEEVVLSRCSRARR